MKIAVPIEVNNSDATITSRFARSPFFALIDEMTGHIDFIENRYCKIQNGIGKEVVKFLVEHGVDTFLAYEIGLKIKQFSVEYKIQVIQLHEKNKTLQSIIQLLDIKKQKKKA